MRGVLTRPDYFTVRPRVAHRHMRTRHCMRTISQQVDTPVYIHIRHYTDRSSSRTSLRWRVRARRCAVCAAVRDGRGSGNGVSPTLSRVFCRVCVKCSHFCVASGLVSARLDIILLVWKNELLNLIKNRTNEARRTSDKRACGERVRSCAQLAGLVRSQVSR